MFNGHFMTSRLIQGYELIDIREMYESCGRLKHGSNGISLRVSQWNIVVRNIMNVNAFLKEPIHLPRPPRVTRASTKAKQEEQELKEVKKEEDVEVKREAITEVKVEETPIESNVASTESEESKVFSNVKVISQ